MVEIGIVLGVNVAAWAWLRRSLAKRLDAKMLEWYVEARRDFDYKLNAQWELTLGGTEDVPGLYQLDDEMQNVWKRVASE